MIRIGCSGWNYKHWRGPVYPEGMPARLWFDHYSSLFDTVEINNTFYKLPDADTFANWRDRAPAGFLYAIKASRFLTHLKRLREPEEPVTRLFENARELGDRFGPILYQLPGNFHCDHMRLADFLAILPRTLGEAAGTPKAVRLQHVIEFRHPSWYVDTTYQLLESHNVTMCLHDKAGSAITFPFVGPIAYIRFHGPGGRYFGRYELSRLETWARRLTDARCDVYAYFNNDPEGMAVFNAQEMRELVSARPSVD
ncbi:MAG TPA: DUF72 domain-containing protein [Vicinamibacterales bacterium]|nr:DUF72 domain-containing protein [Vicinamibacterales bacterium]